MNPNDLTQKLKLVDDLVREGRVFEASTRELEEGLLALCDQNTAQAHTVKEINKGLLFSAILMERRSQKTNRLVIFLAIVGVIVGVAQIVVPCFYN